MKKLLMAALALVLLSPNADAFSLFGTKTGAEKQGTLKSYITQKSVRFQEDYAKRQEINEIRNNLCLLNKYSNEHNIEGIISLYDKKYRSFDGFGYETFKKMLKETFEIYTNISYRSEIKDIVLYDGAKAVVTLNDITTATITSPKAKKAVKELGVADLSEGELYGECNYAIIMEKIDGKWLITGDNIIAETTYIKYGNAKNIPMQFSAPLETPKGKDYCLTLEMSVPKGTKAIASLGKEAILYPSVEPKEVFRKLPQDGILERVVKANESGFNEYAIASVGLTKIDVLDDFSGITFQMTGLAFLMQRVNTYTELNPVREVKAEPKNAKD